MTEANFSSNVDMACMLSSTYNILSVTVYVMVCAATLFGNSLILISLYKYRKQFKGSLYVLIGNLAAADLFLGLWLLLFIYEEINPEIQQVWYFCIAKPVGVVISYCCSIFSLIGISFDRFMAVTFPLKHLVVKTQKRNFFMACVAGNWVISFIIGCLPTVLSNLKQPNTTFVCRLGATIPREFDLISSTGLLVTALINFTLYGIVMWKIRTKETPGNSSYRNKNTKTILMLIVFVLFVVCWLPFIICSFIMQTNITLSTFQNVLCAREYLATLGFVNSALNCVIYGLANKKFRTAFRKVLCCKCCTYISRSLPLSTNGSKVNRGKCSVDPKLNVLKKKEICENNFHSVVGANATNDTDNNAIEIQ